MKNTVSCPKCNGNMTKGLYISPTLSLGGIEWTNKLEFSKWKIENITSVKTSHFACDKCGYIESYLQR